MPPMETPTCHIEGCPVDVEFEFENEGLCMTHLIDYLQAKVNKYAERLMIAKSQFPYPPDAWEADRKPPTGRRLPPPSGVVFF